MWAQPSPIWTTQTNTPIADACGKLTDRMDIAFLAHGNPGRPGARRAEFEQAAQIIYTNFMAPVSLLTWLANYCVQRHAGVIAVLSSVAGERGRKSNYIYASSKPG